MQRGREQDAVRSSSRSRKQMRFRRNSADGHKQSKSGRPVARGVALLHAALPH